MTDAGCLVGTAEYYEVVWPLDRRDYLTVEPHPLVMSPEPPAPATPAITAITVASQAAGDGRRLAAKALLRGAHCPRKRIIELLRISKWTLERIAQRKTVADTPDPKVLEMAHACLEESSSRGSTPEERAAAFAWLQTPTIATTTTAETPVASVGRDARNANAIVDPPVAAAAPPERADLGRRPRTASSRPPAQMKSAEGRSVQDREPLRSRTTLGGTAKNGAHAGLAVTQLEAVSQQQRRILNRTLILDSALKADALDPMREALADLLGDITTAAREIGAIVQQATR